MRKYSKIQTWFMLLSIILPPLQIWLYEGTDTDFWINVALSLAGVLPGALHSSYVSSTWFYRKWQTRHGREVTKRPFYIFSKEFEYRSRWKGNGHAGFIGYFDDDLRGGHGPNMVGGDIDPEQARIIEPKKKKEKGSDKKKGAKGTKGAKGAEGAEKAPPSETISTSGEMRPSELEGPAMQQLPIGQYHAYHGDMSPPPQSTPNHNGSQPGLARPEPAYHTPQLATAQPRAT